MLLSGVSYSVRAAEYSLGLGLASENRRNGLGFWIIKADQVVVVIGDDDSSLSSSRCLGPLKVVCMAGPSFVLSRARQGVNLPFGRTTRRGDRFVREHTGSRIIHHRGSRIQQGLLEVNLPSMGFPSSAAHDRANDSRGRLPDSTARMSAIRRGFLIGSQADGNRCPALLYSQVLHLRKSLFLRELPSGQDFLLSILRTDCCECPTHKAHRL